MDSLLTNVLRGDQVQRDIPRGVDIEFMFLQARQALLRPRPV